VDGGKIGVLKERDEIGFCRLLQGHNSRRLEAQVSLQGKSMSPWFASTQEDFANLKVLCDLTHETLEGQLPDEEFS